MFDPKYLPVGVVGIILGRSPAIEEMADPLVQDTHGADPGAEKPAEDERTDDHDKRECQPLVNGPARQECGKGDEGVEFQEEGDFIALHIAEISNQDQKHEEHKKEDRVDSPDVLQGQDSFYHDYVCLVLVLSLCNIRVAQKGSRIIGFKDSSEKPKRP